PGNFYLDASADLVADPAGIIVHGILNADFLGRKTFLEPDDEVGKIALHPSVDGRADRGNVIISIVTLDAVEITDGIAGQHAARDDQFSTGNGNQIRLRGLQLGCLRV